MKTVRTRVKSAFNPKRTTSKPLNDFQDSLFSSLDSTSTAASGTSAFPPEQQVSSVQSFATALPLPPPPILGSQTAPPPTLDPLQAFQMAKLQISEFHLDSDPFADLSSSLPPPNLNSNAPSGANSNNSRRNTVTKGQQEIPTEEKAQDHRSYQQPQQRDVEESYPYTLGSDETEAQTITITDDSKRSTPNKRKKILTVIPPIPGPPSSFQARSELEPAPATAVPPANQSTETKIERSPVNVTLSYFQNEPDKHQSLLDQPHPTESAFHEITPPQETQSMPPLHEILLTEKYQLQRRSDSPIQIQPDHLTPLNLNDESKPLLDPSFQTSEIDHILESSTVWPLPAQTFPTLGWTEHVLPSSVYYYSHAATRTVTDLDLRDNKKLDALTRYLDAKRALNSGSNLKSVSDAGGSVDHPRGHGFEQNGHGIGGSSGRDTNTIRTLRTEPEFLAEEGIDIWIRDANGNSRLSTNGGGGGGSAISNNTSSIGTTFEYSFMPLTNWIMHATRTVSYDPPSNKDPAPEDLSDAERLGLERKYWQYMCTHPAHVSVPQSAYDEALEVLTWCYTDSVLGADSVPPPLRPFPPPFTYNECTALLELIRNISTSASSQTIRTRLIAQTLLRYTEWRQKYITRSVPVILPGDNNSNTAIIGQTGNTSQASSDVVEHAVPLRKTFEFFVKSILCLGIPYLLERNGSCHVDGFSNEEEQGERAVGKTSKMNTSIASQPILAALILSGSTTMLTLPNLNQITRGSALMSALFAVMSVASYGISLYGRYQHKRHSSPHSNPAREHRPRTNQVPYSSVILSVPLVLLTYSLCSFVTGVLAYGIVGSANNAITGFGQVTGWVILAAWIALVGILAAFAVCQ